MMLPTHGRYGYSSIPQHADYTWPENKRLAVYVAVNIEQFRFAQGKGAAIARQHFANSLRTGAGGAREGAPGLAGVPPTGSRLERSPGPQPLRGAGMDAVARRQI
jgi:hypothetical protein